MDGRALRKSEDALKPEQIAVPVNAASLTRGAYQAETVHDP